MDTKTKIYKDSEEIDRAWKELIDSIEPLHVTRFKSSFKAPEDAKSAHPDKTKRLSHPALLTQGDLKNWEFFW